MFTRFTGGTPAIEEIVLHSLPANGALSLNGTALTEAGAIAVADLSNLMFTPAADFNGEVSVGWHAQAGGVASSTNNQLTITVNAVNDAPSFTLQNGTTSVKAGQNAFVTVATPVVAAAPADEADQTLTYSVSPTSVNFLNVSFNEQTGELQVSPIAKIPGTVTFSITASDGQSVNSTASQSVSFEVTKSSSGGGMGLLALLSLPLLALRRRLKMAK
jgi:hypothetical protein